jgi:hypothetical protein
MKELPPVYKKNPIKWCPVKPGKIYDKLKKKQEMFSTGRVKRLQFFLGIHPQTKQYKFKAYKINDEDFVIQGVLCKTKECLNIARSAGLCNNCDILIKEIQ